MPEDWMVKNIYRGHTSGRRLRGRDDVEDDLKFIYLFI
jgi:hypothetical protein